MQEENILIIITKLRNIFTPSVLTIIILLIMLFRVKISNLIVEIAYKVLKVKKKEGKKHSSTAVYFRIIIIAVGVLFITQIWSENEKLIDFLNTLVRILLIFTVAKLLSSMATPEGPFVQKLIEDEFIDKNIVLNNFLTKIIQVGIYVFAIFIAISELGYDINGLVAGLGIGSAIIALAVQDVVKNLIAGATIVSEKPFEVGDWIQMGTDEGAVENITLRNTVIRKLNNSLVTIPNSRITVEPITNYTAIESRRVEMTLPLPLETPSYKLKRIISKIKISLENNPKVIARTVNVVFRNITNSANEIFIFCYITESKFVKYLAENDKINFDIMKILEVENVEIAYPRQKIALIPETEVLKKEFETKDKENFVKFEKTETKNNETKDKNESNNSANENNMNIRNN